MLDLIKPLVILVDFWVDLLVDLVQSYQLNRLDFTKKNDGITWYITIDISHKQNACQWQKIMV